MAHDIPAARSARGMQVGKIATVIVIGCGIGLFVYFDLARWLSLEALKANRDHLLAFTEANYTGAVVLFIALYIAVTGLSIPSRRNRPRVGTLEDPGVEAEYLRQLVGSASAVQDRRHQDAAGRKWGRNTTQC